MRWLAMPANTGENNDRIDSDVQAAEALDDRGSSRSLQVHRAEIPAHAEARAKALLPDRGRRLRRGHLSLEEQGPRRSVLHGRVEGQGDGRVRCSSRNPLCGCSRDSGQPAGSYRSRVIAGLMWANMLRAFQVGKALTSDGWPSSWMRSSRVAWAQVSWPACHLTKASASAVM